MALRISSVSVGVQREGARSRHRTIRAGGGGEAEFWLEHGTQRVTMKTRHQLATGGGSGASNWERCSNADCLGQRLPIDTRCLLHADGNQRSQYYASIPATSRYLHLNGVVVTDAERAMESIRFMLGLERVDPRLRTGIARGQRLVGFDRLLVRPGWPGDRMRM